MRGIDSLFSEISVLALVILLAVSAAPFTALRQQPAKPSFDPALAQALAEGNTALQAGRYSDAIAAYDRGLAIDPTQMSLRWNRSVALRQRGVQNWNASTKTRDQTLQAAARADWAAGARSADEALA